MAFLYLVVSLDDRGKKIGDLLRSEIGPEIVIERQAGPAHSTLAAFLHQPSDQDLSSGVRALLSGRPAAVLGLEVRLVGELLAPGTAARLRTLLEQLSRVVPDLLPGIPAVTEILLVVPHERTAWNDEALAFLAGHRSPLLWLVSPFNGRLFTDDELDFLCAQFLALDITAGLPAQLWEGDRPRGGNASFGLSGLVVPVRELRTRTAFRLASGVLALMASSGSAEVEMPTGDQWLSARRVTLPELTAAVREGADIPLSERERKVVLREGDEPAWPDRLWSVFYFFGFEGLARQDQRITANRNTALNAALRALRESVDDLVARSFSPAGALRFLEGLGQAAARERGEKIEIGGARVHLHSAIEGLKEAYLRLPASYQGLLARVLIGAFGAAYLLHLLVPTFLPAARGHPLLSFWGLLGLLGLMGTLAATLFYMDRRNDFGRARLGAESALWKGLEYIVAARAHNSALDVLDAVICTAASPSQREEFRTACEGIESTYDAVSGYATRLHEAARIAWHRGDEPITTSPFLALPVKSPAALVEFTHDRLAMRLVGEGFHRGWRDAEPGQIAEKAARLVDEAVGASFVETLADAFPPASDPEAARLVRSLIEGSRPLLLPGPGALPPRRLVFARGGADSPVAWAWHREGTPARWQPLDDPYTVVALSIAQGLAADDLSGGMPGQTAGHD